MFIFYAMCFVACFSKMVIQGFRLNDKVYKVIYTLSFASLVTGVVGCFYRMLELTRTDAKLSVFFVVYILCTVIGWLLYFSSSDFRWYELNEFDKYRAISGLLCGVSLIISLIFLFECI